MTMQKSSKNTKNSIVSAKNKGKSQKQNTIAPSVGLLKEIASNLPCPRWNWILSHRDETSWNLCYA